MSSSALSSPLFVFGNFFEGQSEDFLFFRIFGGVTGGGGAWCYTPRVDNCTPYKDTGRGGGLVLIRGQDAGEGGEGADGDRMARLFASD